MIKKSILFTILIGLYLFSVIPFLDRTVLTNSPYDMLPALYNDALVPVSNFYPFKETILPSSNVVITLFVVPINFKDEALSITSNQISQLFSGAGKSISNYYSDNSDGSVIFSSIVLPAYTTINNKALYADYTNNYIALPAEIGVYVSNYIVANISNNSGVFEDIFDINNDRFVDCIVFYHAGTGFEVSGNSNDILSHNFSFFRFKDIYIYDTLYLGRYIFASEIINKNATIWDQRSTIGPLCHSLGTLIGLPDLYDVKSGDSILGNSALMDRGCYNYVSGDTYFDGSTNRPVYGSTPAPICGFYRTLAGWDSPVLLDGEQSGDYFEISPFSPMSNSSNLYRLQSIYNNEYWLVEYRNGLSWDASLSGDGLLIWHIDENMGGDGNDDLRYDYDFNSSFEGVSLEIADNNVLNNLTTAPHELIVANFWTGGAFGVQTIPSSKYYDGTPSKISLSDINISSSNYSFLFTNVFFKKYDTFFLPNPFFPVTDQKIVITIYGENLSSTSDDVKIYITGYNGVLVNSFSGVDLHVEIVDDKSMISLTWDGLDKNGVLVNPGLYYYRVVTEKESGLAGRFVVDYE